jgi:peptidyl-prolyl cis-trans isomerase D
MALGFFRRHQWLLKWFLGAVVVSFILIYIPALTGSGVSGGGSLPNDTVGKVGDLRVTVAEYEAAYRLRRQEIDQMTRGRMDAETLKRLGVPEQVFEGLVQNRLLELEARRLGITVDDDAVRKDIETTVQRDGHFIGADELRRYLASKGTSEEDFINQTRESILQHRLETLVTAGVSVSPEEAEREYRRRNEQVKAAYVHIDAGRFKDQVSVTDEAARSRFDEQKEAYKVPERRVVSYILIDPQILQAGITVSPKEIDDYYTNHQDEFREEAQTCASHILVRVQAQPGAKEGHSDADAKALAEKLLARIKGGEDFGKVAKEASEDPGSKQAGGDLGCYTSGKMVPEFEKAAAALEPGQISDVVKSSFGYHIIKVANRKPESIVSREQARDRIKVELLAQKARASADAAAQRIASSLSKGRTLDEVAKTEKTTVLKSVPFAQGDAPEPVSSPGLVSRAFELKKGETASDPFQVNRGYAFIQLAEIQPPHLPEWSEVKDKVKADLVMAGAFDKAREKAEELRKLADKEGLDKAATALGLVRKESPGMVARSQAIGDLPSGAALDAAVFSLKPKSLSDPVRVADGYAVLEVLETKPFDPAAYASVKASFTAGLENEKKGKVFQSYMMDVRKRETVEKVPDVYDRIAG